MLIYRMISFIIRIKRKEKKHWYKLNTQAKKEIAAQEDEQLHLALVESFVTYQLDYSSHDHDYIQGERFGQTSV